MKTCIWEFPRRSSPRWRHRIVCTSDVWGMVTSRYIDAGHRIQGGARFYRPYSRLALTCVRTRLCRHIPLGGHMHCRHIGMVWRYTNLGNVAWYTQWKITVKQKCDRNILPMWQQSNIWYVIVETVNYLELSELAKHGKVGVDIAIIGKISVI